MDTLPTGPAPVQTASPESAAGKSRAHTFFWFVLATAAAVSLTGNATQALLHTTALPAVAAAVAVIPPLALLAAVHGVSVLARAHGGARATHVVAIAMTALIAAGAFWLSFTALRSLAVTAGVPRHEAWLWPLIIEGSMAQATVALLTLAHTPEPAPDHAGHGHTGTQPASAPVHTPPVLDDSDLAKHGSAPVHTPPRSPIDDSDVTERDNATVQTPSPRPSETVDVVELAAQLCARDPAGRRDPDLVARALTHHYRDGWNPTRIGLALDRSRSTISRILSDATQLTTAATGPAATTQRHADHAATLGTHPLADQGKPGPTASGAAPHALPQPGPGPG